MSNPVTVSCPADTWTKVATAITSAQIYFGPASTGTSPSSFRMTYRVTGGAAPTTEYGVVLPFGDRDEGQRSYRADHGEPVDVYFMAVGGTGEAVLHEPIGGEANFTEASSISNDVAIVAAPVGGINVPTDDGIVMDGFPNIAFQIHLRGGQSNAHADRTATLKFQGSNDVTVGAVREWVDLAVGYDLGTDATAASWVSVGLTDLDALVEFEGVSFKRIRANYAFDAAPGADHPGAVVITERRTR